MEDYLILAVAAFFAGTLNTVAGGGTFLTFPALVYAGVPVVSANATSAVAVAATQHCLDLVSGRAAIELIATAERDFLQACLA